MPERTTPTDVIVGALALVAGISLNDFFKDTIDARIKPNMEEIPSESEIRNKYSENETMLVEKLEERKKLEDDWKYKWRWYAFKRALYAGIVIAIVVIIIVIIYQTTDIIDTYKANYRPPSSTIINANVKVV